MNGSDAQRGRLAARVAGTGAADEGPGLRRIRLAPERDALVLAPAAYDAARPAPLVVVLHGAGGTGQQALDLLAAAAERHGLLLLAPTSAASTWDVIRGGYGPDVAHLDALLADTFHRYAVDGARVAIAGFSDGASYALSLGVGNGDLFGAVLAYSPGFLAPPARRGRPRIYISHGIGDRVLPVDRCSRRIVPGLRAEGYDVRYDEFRGGHVVPPEIVDESLRWWLGD